MVSVSTKFDPDLDLILIEVEIDGPRQPRRFTFALDTAAGMTLVTHDALDEIGYNARHGDYLTTVTSVVGQEKGYALRVARFQALGHTFTDFRVNAQDLPDNAGVKGLLGLDFLRNFNCEIRFKEGRILTTPA
jgi:predicted aspartyl protease